VIGEAGEHFCYCLKETEFFKSYRSENSDIDMSMAWRDMTPAELMQLEGSIETLAGKKLISKEYCELLIQVLKKNPPKVPEQGRKTWGNNKPSVIAGSSPEKANPKEIHICLNDDNNEMNCSLPSSPIMVHPPGSGSGVRKVEIQLDDESD